MKKALIISVAINILILIAFASKRYYYSRQPQADAKVRNTFFDQWDAMRTSLFVDCPVNNTDVVFVGNSLTEAFPVTELFGPRYKNRGIGGNSTEHILHRIQGIAKGRPKKIFLEGGVNDLIAGIPVDSMINNYKLIIGIISSESPATMIYVQSLFPTSLQYSYLNKTIVDANALIANYCKKHGVEYIDLHSRMTKSEGLDKSLTEDGIHLNGKGYTIWQKTIEQYLR